MTGTTQKQQKVKIEDGQDCNTMVVICCNGVYFVDHMLQLYTG